VSLQFRAFAAASSPTRCAKCGGLHRSPITAAVSHVVTTLVGPPPDLAAALGRKQAPDALIAGLTAGRSDIGPAPAVKRAASAPVSPDLKNALKKEKR
jgi:hypothetical protein